MSHPTTASIGSAWDAAAPGPEALANHHLAEWLASAVAPELVAANVVTLQGASVLEALAGDRLAQLGAHAQQHATAPVQRLLRPLEPLADAGGWWCSGLDPLADWAPIAWGCLKPDAPRWDPERNRSRKYEHPVGVAARLFWLAVPAVVAQRVAQRFRLALPPVVAADADGRSGAFWKWWAKERRLPLLITEGGKKAAALLSIGIPAVALPGIWNGAPKNPATGRPALLPELAAVPLKRRSCWVLFDASDKPNPDEPKAARRLGELLRFAGGIDVRVGTVPGTHGKGADDHLAAGGSWEALAAALLPLVPLPVLPYLRAADRIAPAGQYLGVACPLPSPAVAPLLLLQAPMGCGKTEAIAAAVAPLRDAGVSLLVPSHRVALGQALAERLGVAWAPSPGTDERQLGAGFCLDSACPSSALRISGHSWSGGVFVWDEIAQGLEHLLLSIGTALAPRRGSSLAARRAEVLRAVAELLARAGQVIAADAQLPQWVLNLLEALTGRRAVLIRSEHQPMAGRHLHAPHCKNPKAAADAFRARWGELVMSGASFLCWTAAQKARFKNSPQTLAALHRKWNPAARVVVIDSTTPELAAELAADPDGFAQRFDAIYVSPSISSGVSFRTWKPDAVIAYAGGHIAPEHAAQALARVRCPDVPAYLYAPERSPGDRLLVGSGDTDPARVLAALRAVSDPLLGVLEEAAPEGAWLTAYGEMAAHRNRQNYAYGATIAGLLELEGWEIQPEGPAPCPVLGARVAGELEAIAEAAQEAEDAAIIAAPLLEPAEADALTRRRKLEPAEQAALNRYRLAQRWGLGAAVPSPELLEADRDKVRKPLRLGFLLTDPEALALIGAHDRAAVVALDRTGRPFAPDRLRVAHGPRVAAFHALKVPELLERFQAGETIAATDPAVLTLHANATAHRGQLAAAAGVSPGKLASGTLRNMLRAVGWELVSAGRIHTRDEHRKAMAYRAEPVALPEGVDREALEAVFLEELAAAAGSAGPLSAHTSNPRMEEKWATPPPPPLPPPLMAWPSAPLAVIPWHTAPPPPRSAPRAVGFRTADRG